MENEEVDKKKKLSKRITILVVFLAVFAIVIIILMNLFSEKVTTTTGGVETTSSASLYCTTKSKNIPDAFFDVSDAESADQAIKVIFKNNKIDNISYNATLTYADAEKAKAKSAEFTTNYNRYIQDEGKNGDILSPVFSSDGNATRIAFYGNDNQLDNKLARLFLIDTSETSLGSYTLKVLSTLYKTKGFTCENKE